MSENGDNNVCAICKNTTFYSESGFFYCTQCQTQKEDATEQINDAQFDSTTRKHKIRIHQEKKAEKHVIGWTSWELYNFVLIGMTNELIEIGVDPSIKLTILQLWSYYLTKLQVAFTSKTKKCIPKMARRYHKKDAEIIYGKIQRRKTRRKRGSSTNTSKSLISTSIGSISSASRKDFVRSQRLVMADHNELSRSQMNSDTDANSSMNQSLHSLQSSFSKASSNNVRLNFTKRAKLEAKKAKEKSKKVPHAKKVRYQKNYVSNQYVTGPDVLTPLKLWSIIYLALRIHNQKIYISDMLRFSRENHLTYYKLDNLIPVEVTLTKNDVNFLTQTTDISHKGLRRTAAKMACFLHITELPEPDILGLIKRYCEDLELPRGIMLYAARVYLSSPCVMKYTAKSSLIPNYEGRAMAYIIVVLKTLFGLDDITEKEINRVVDKINRAAADRDILLTKLFNFFQWQQFIECRKTLLASVHFPSKLKYDPESTNKSHLYLRFIGLLKSKRICDPPEFEKGKHVISQDLLNAMDQCINNLNDNDLPLREMVTFPPSLTPMKFYISQLDENSHVDVPFLLQTKFYDTKVGYMTKPESLVEMASHCDITLKVVDSSVHYLEKIVPPFEQTKLPEVSELSELVKIKAPNPNEGHTQKQTTNLLDYTFRNRTCKLKVNPESFHYYSSVCSKELELEETLNFEEDSFFDKVLPDGRLDIENDNDSEDEDTLSQSALDGSNFKMDKEFFKKQKIQLYSHELEALNNSEKPEIVKNVLYRGLKGRFTKSTDKNVKKEYKKVVVLSEGSSDDEIEMEIKIKAKTKDSTKNNSSQTEVKEENKYFELSESDISILDEDVTVIDETKCKNETNPLDINEILFRPYKDYWMYHCNFSRVKGKNFELFEKELPETFLWLLNECANMVEMSNEDLYEEVCLVEAFHLNILKTAKSKKDDDYKFHDCNSKSYKNNVTSKW